MDQSDFQLMFVTTGGWISHLSCLPIVYHCGGVNVIDVTVVLATKGAMFQMVAPDGVDGG